MIILEVAAGIIIAWVVIGLISAFVNAGAYKPYPGDY